MSSLLKDIYSKEFYDQFSETLGEVLPSFNKRKFVRAIFDSQWDRRELKDRMKHTALVLSSFFPSDFSRTVELMEQIVAKLRQRNIQGSSLKFMFLPDYIETYGLHDFDSSVRSMEFLTQFTSCEFAVRPFIVKYGDRMVKQMEQWSWHASHHVRRLASEGSRPRLPWAMALPELKKDPVPILPILENLKNDPSEYVRRSVANSLNDISKDNPGVYISIARRWKGYSQETDAIIKHASRTLLKQGNPDILNYFGLAGHSSMVTGKFHIHTPAVLIGDNLEFSFTIQNTGRKPLKVRIEYALHYLRSRGGHSKKVFKISERHIKPGEKIHLQRRQSFKIITTRRFYPGPHKLSLIINGQERGMGKFELRDRQGQGR